MTIPQTAPPLRSPTMSHHTHAPVSASGGPKRVLLADDERLLHSVLGDVLEGYGYAVLHAMDGEQAVHLARESRPDVILMDIMMPVMTGTEALDQLKSDEDTRDIPVVAITADVLGRTRDQMLGRGFDGYIPKPFTAGQLLGEIARYAARDGDGGAS